MGEVLPLRFGGGGGRALVGAMVACVSSVFVYSYRTATASKGQRIRVIPSTRWLAWGCPRGKRTAGEDDGQATPTVSRNCCSGHRKPIDLAKRARGRGLGLRRGVPREVVFLVCLT